MLRIEFTLILPSNEVEQMPPANKNPGARTSGLKRKGGPKTDPSARG